MKTKIKELLATKFEGVSDAILNRMAEKLAKTATNEEEAKSAVEGVTFQQMLESYGDSRATEAANSAVTNYEKRHNIKDGKPVEDNKPKDDQKDEGNKNDDKKDDEEMPAWAKSLVEANKAMADKLAAIDTEKTAKGRKAQLEGVLKDLPKELQDNYMKNFDRMTFADEDDFSKYLEETKTDTEAVVAKMKTLTPPMGGNHVGGQGGADNPILKERIAEQQKEAESQASVISGLNK